ncbi:MAG TPA: hypothetical protein VGW32_05655, partial [Pyrinomonadaceae bacterium]|nr:hypothetical protein [Pyrinomonadaceae bacterium]
MIEEREPIDVIEPERYEIFEAPQYSFTFDRRDFIKTFGLGLVFVVPVTRALAQRGESGRGGFNQTTPTDVGAWIHI